MVGGRGLGGGGKGGTGWVGLNLNPKLSTLHRIPLSKKFYSILYYTILYYYYYSYIHMIALS
jgi:hypothetical protein